MPDKAYSSVPLNSIVDQKYFKHNIALGGIFIKILMNMGTVVYFR